MTAGIIAALIACLPFILRLVVQWLEKKDAEIPREDVEAMGSAMADGRTDVIGDLLDRL